MNEQELREFLKKNLKIEITTGRWNSGMCAYETKVALHLVTVEDGSYSFDENTVICSDTFYTENNS